MPFSQFCFLRFDEKFCVYLQVPGVKEVLRRRDVPLQAAEEEEGPQRAQAAPLRLLHILHRGETQSEGGEPQLFYLRRGQGAGQTVGRNGPRSQAKVPIFFFVLYCTVITGLIVVEQNKLILASASVAEPVHF